MAQVFEQEKYHIMFTTACGKREIGPEYNDWAIVKAVWEAISRTDVKDVKVYVAYGEDACGNPHWAEIVDVKEVVRVQ